MDVLKHQFDTQMNGRYNMSLEKAFAEKFNMPFGQKIVGQLGA